MPLPNLPRRLSSVDNIIASFKGKEDQIFDALRNKYDDPASPDYIPPQGRQRLGEGSGKNKQKSFFGIFS